MLTTLAFAIALVVFAVLLTLVGLFLYDNLANPGRRYRVDGITIVYESVVCRLLFRLGYVWAFTLGTTIYVKGDWLAPSALRHELEHVRQWKASGALWFIMAYIDGLIRHGFAKHPLEVEARRAAARITQLV